MVRWCCATTSHRTVSAYRTITKCDILALKKADLDTVLENYPQLREQVTRMADIRSNCLHDVRRASTDDVDKVSSRRHVHILYECIYVRVHV